MIQRVDEALAFLKISGLRDRDTFNLAGGKKQKVGLAGVLAMRPSILLLDEPLAGLGPARAQDSLDMMEGLADGRNDLIGGRVSRWGCPTHEPRTCHVHGWGTSPLLGQA